MSTSELVLKRQQNRYKILKAVYDAGSNEYTPVNFSEIGKHLGLTREEINDAERYLVGERLVRLFDDQDGVCLTHQGILEVEASVSEPNKATTHFQPQVTQYYYGTIGAVQNASHSVATVNQNIGASTPELLQILSELRECLQKAMLSSEQRTEALELVDSIEDETKSSSPKQSKIKAFVKSLAEFAVDTTLKAAMDKLFQNTGLTN